MGRIIKREIVGFTCELRSCGQIVRTHLGYPANGTWHDQLEELERLIGLGWSIVLHPQIRTYCPDHADRVWDCSCRTHPTRASLCTSHNTNSEGLVWTDRHTPQQVEDFRKVIS
ncbi:hypothetical protein [Leucobacter aridicollis]|uniref:hypothetical protein n=1 Tax=Leucobacter aridicollis TaxID=283878 RepID=UPI0021676B93|nr:hypothetical protein [Leucobacter aridicollis]MCS3427616.1 hypothetical protein [Leucobacter aridicollis]